MWRYGSCGQFFFVAAIAAIFSLMLPFVHSLNPIEVNVGYRRGSATYEQMMTLDDGPHYRFTQRDNTLQIHLPVANELTCRLWKQIQTDPKLAQYDEAVAKFDISKLTISYRVMSKPLKELEVIKSADGDQFFERFEIEGNEVHVQLKLDKGTKDKIEKNLLELKNDTLELENDKLKMEMGKMKKDKTYSDKYMAVQKNIIQTLVDSMEKLQKKIQTFADKPDPAALGDIKDLDDDIKECEDDIEQLETQIKTFEKALTKAEENEIEKYKQYLQDMILLEAARERNAAFIKERGLDVTTSMYAWASQLDIRMGAVFQKSVTMTSLIDMQIKLVESQVTRSLSKLSPTTAASQELEAFARLSYEEYRRNQASIAALKTAA